MIISISANTLIIQGELLADQQGKRLGEQV